MSRTRSYRDLRVYREAFALAMEMFELTRRFPDHEKYDLARQVRRSSRSVCANTAEAWRRRHYPAALVAKVVDAEAEAAETRVHIEFAHACGYLPTEVAADLDARYDRLLARLTTMRTRPEKWVPRTGTEAGVSRKVESQRRPSAARTTTPHPPASTKRTDSHRQPSSPATPPRAPAREVDSHGRQPAAANSAQEEPTKSPARGAMGRRRDPPSAVEGAQMSGPP